MKVLADGTTDREESEPVLLVAKDGLAELYSTAVHTTIECIHLKKKRVIKLSIKVEYASTGRSTYSHQHVDTHLTVQEDVVEELL